MEPEKRHDQSRQPTAPHPDAKQSGQAERRPSYSKRMLSTCFHSQPFDGTSRRGRRRVFTPLRSHFLTTPNSQFLKAVFSPNIWLLSEMLFAVISDAHFRNDQGSA